MNDDTTVFETAEHLVDQLREGGELQPAARGGVVLPPARTEAAAKKPEVTISIVEMSHPDNMGALFESLAMAQASFGPIQQRMTARIQSRREGGANYSYNYAPLDEVLAAVIPALSQNGIALMQFPLALPSKNALAVRTMLAHKSGVRLWNDLVIGCNSADPKDIGSAITYARRYALQALLGIAPDSDDDGARASGRDQETTERRAQNTQRSSQTVQAESEDVPELVTACRSLKRGNRTLYGIKTTSTEVWTDDEDAYMVAKLAAQNETRVIIRREMRKVENQNLRWLTEIVQPK